MKLRKILVPINGNMTDRETITLACQLAKKEKGRVFAIYVIEVKRTLPLDAEIEQDIENGGKVLNLAEQVAEEAGYEIETELLQARDVGPAVVDEAVERSVDLIIIGLPYKKRFGEFNLGRTAPYVLRNAPCRVWLCREPIQ